jgi:hypothetical protein
MAIIHNTTMSPGKLELLTAWLPAQPWYLDTGHKPELTKAGGFRASGAERQQHAGPHGDRPARDR